MLKPGRLRIEFTQIWENSVRISSVLFFWRCSSLIGKGLASGTCWQRKCSTAERINQLFNIKFHFLQVSCCWHSARTQLTTLCAIGGVMFTYVYHSTNNLIFCNKFNVKMFKKPSGLQVTRPVIPYSKKLWWALQFGKQSLNRQTKSSTTKIGTCECEWSTELEINMVSYEEER